MRPAVRTDVSCGEGRAGPVRTGGRDGRKLRAGQQSPEQGSRLRAAATPEFSPSAGTWELPKGLHQCLPPAEATFLPTGLEGAELG